MEKQIEKTCCLQGITIDFKRGDWREAMAREVKLKMPVSEILQLTKKQ